MSISLSISPRTPIREGMDPTLPKAPPRFSLPLMELAWLRRLVRRRGVPLSDVDDVLQEVSLRVWQKRALVEAADEPGAYITEIAKQAARDYHRRSLRREPSPVAEDPSQAEGRGPTPEHHALIRQCCAIVGGFLDQIDDKARPLFVERAFDGDSVAEIAARHGLPERRVKAFLELARRDFEAAKQRWEAKDRRRGGGPLWALAFPFWSIDLRRWLRSLSHATARIAVALPALLLTAVACPADLHSSEPRQTLERWGHLLSSRSARPEPGSPADDDLTPVLPPAQELPERRVTVQATSIMTRPSASEQPLSLPMEEKLIGGARAVLLLGTPEGRVRAHLLLLEHRERFPAGHLAREREELLSQLR
jgi:RNA polymerase sigma-19 factor, ECF subfamily